MQYSDHDVALAAQRIIAGSEYCIAAGPAALGGQLAALLGPAPTQDVHWPRVRTCLVVNGSQHPISVQQIEEAIRSGCRWRVFTSECPAGTSELEYARRIGCQVRAELQATAPDGLVVFGGDTAYGILS